MGLAVANESVRPGKLLRARSPRGAGTVAVACGGVQHTSPNESQHRAFKHVCVCVGGGKSRAAGARPLGNTLVNGVRKHLHGS